MKLALFDLDHTLLNTDSDHSWGEFLVNEGLVDPVHHRQMNDKFYEDYKAGQLDPIAYNEFVFEFLTQNTPEVLTELHALFMQKVIRPQMRPKGFDAIQKHQDLGHEIVGITATSDFITAPIFRAFGITEIIATTAEVQQGKYTGKVAGTPCYQQGKLVRLEQWLAGRNVEESWAYSDSINDRFLLEYATHAIAVNPDDRLEKLAKAQNWQIQDWSI
ncbi:MULTISPECIES: HAD family hydrolase [Acinetobacter]|jgi:HAD superfamily hydrolase (TIGR01490 family)|uniref:HAD family hydrolase n=2 Tax=Acinetobacter TaxID=469 RepID=A0A1P8EM43_9GAMM|nr:MULTISPECIES: HAD family hydrolase [Acinetobacter]APV37290.1 haloacid dehalogenase [Acinetobacter soli]ENV58577.1 HAD hydrolase, family IB [Acinetobacter soli CIP 110264]KOR14853.1 haloacid dehalogenase [Acinetobacter sp. C15]KQD05502.1 haloacid dehalogenase [Acinetobacter soli]MBO3640091.1 HAD-IB family hydrolase [Acinetobacter soli]